MFIVIAQEELPFAERANNYKGKWTQAAKGIDSRKEKERRISLIQQYVYEIAQRNQLSIGNSQGGYGISQG